MNFKTLTQDLIDAGMTKAEIARGIGYTPQSLHCMLTSAHEEPDMIWRYGDALISMHKAHCKRNSRRKI